ncbi:hypothetical protein HNP82_001302 [Catenibacillus scindens]|uniref:Nucleotidyltransferase family protein n=1 Tax=Catenibacillus scindens TaxID=673271 RepID=A0A7W8M5B8_9FIRM|nr:nucleotidyltransferase family protein [Catenibacillus scindens]MBB5264191.1 hypothetical protein [Catenibacillus scindens]
MLTEDQKVVLYLFKCALHGQKADPRRLKTEYSSFSWTTVMEIARSHNILPVIFSVSEDVADFVRHPDFPKLTRQVMSMVAGQIQRNQALLELYRAFGKAQVPLPLVMKGIVCRELYGDYADYRPSSDEDLLVAREDFFAVAEVLKEQGFVSDKPGVTPAQLEDLQEVSFFQASSGLLVELHVNAIGHENLWRRGVNESFNNVIAHSRVFCIDDVTFRAMEHTEEFVFLTFHALKHLTCGGVGIRQIGDILLYAEKFYDAIDWDKVWQILEENKGSQFLTDICFIGEKYLGISVKSQGSPCCPGDLLPEIFVSGAFGNSTQEQRTAVHLTGAAVSNGDNTWFGRLHVFMTLIFPGRYDLLNMHPELKEKPWLLPVCWVRRWMRFIRHNRETGGNLAAKSLAIGRRRVRLLKKYGLVSGL